METEELTRLVDEIYKNILDKFNPGARQLINAGKTYLKALHGAAAASRVYVDALSRLARQAQLGTWGGSKDIGYALMRIVEVYKEIQEQEMNILKAFYVDLLVPLETNLEKDTKVVQSEQKKFLQQHKTRSETYSKAAATMKKQRKKSRGGSKSGLAMDKELKNMQILEEEKSKLDAFCEQSLKNAMTQERRRYGFVLERQCSLAKHYASFHEVAFAALHPSVDKWREIAATREYLPQSVEDMFASRLRQVSFWPEEEENGGSELTMNSQLRKTRSMDSSCQELRLGPSTGNLSSSANRGPSPHLPMALSRARSEVNLHASTLSLAPEIPETPPRPRSMVPATSRNSSAVVGSISNSNGNNSGLASEGWAEAPLARALFAYLSSGDNQLSFLEGDMIALMGDRQKGWQFGENLRTHSSGWFPLAYTEIVIDDSLGSPSLGASEIRATEQSLPVPPSKPPASRPPVTPNAIDELRNSGGNSGNPGNSNTANNDPSTNASNNNIHHLALPTAHQSKLIRPSGTLPLEVSGGRRVQPPVPPVPPPQAMTSLHSSNDSGFSNEPPIQPDIDYSDDEALRQRKRRGRTGKGSTGTKEHQPAVGKEDKAGNGKDWETDSWKTIPRDERSWHLYRTAIDLWAEANAIDRNEDETVEGYSVRSRRFDDRSHQSNSREFPPGTPAGSADSADKVSPMKKGKKTQERRQFDEEETRSRTNSDQRNKYYSHVNDGNARNSGRYGNAQSIEHNRRQLASKKTKQHEETEEDEAELEREGREEERYAAGIHYKDKNYYAERQNEEEGRGSGRAYHSIERERGREREREREREKGEASYQNEKSSSSSSSCSDDESTITIPESGRKVEQIAQKLEQTAQKYAREHSPPKFIDRRNDYRSLDRQREEKERSAVNYERYPERDDNRSSRRNERLACYREESDAVTRSPANYERESTNERSPIVARNSSSFERERAYEKNPERKKTVERKSSRKFERPRPPSEDPPERPTGGRHLFRQQTSEHRYPPNKQEGVCGESRRMMHRDYRDIDKERGYESNFETKLERTKVLERHANNNNRTSRGEFLLRKPDRNGSNSLEGNDADNGISKDEGKALLPRQTAATATATVTAAVELTSRVFDLESKSPKLVKRTKSFWRFRRDSEVLEGMALWQHRSLVDIPKVIKREVEAEKKKNAESTSRGQDNVEDVENSPKDSSLTEDELRIGNVAERQVEPKPAERSHVPDKADYFDDFPTPAERSKIIERSEYAYRAHRTHQEERSYFVGNVSRKAIIEKERRRSLEAKRNMIVAELKENNEAKRNERRKKDYGDDDDDGLVENFTDTEASDEESTYSCIVVNDQTVAEKTFLPRTKLRKESDREKEKNTCGPWYDLWDADPSQMKKKKKQQ